jgi:hypothetical protein
VPTPTAVVRTEQQHAIAGYSPEFPHSGDLEMWMRFALRGPIGVFRTVQAFYRWHALNMGAQYYNQLLGDRREFILTCEQMLERHGDQFPSADHWRASLHRRVGESALRSARASLELGDPRACEVWLGFAEEVSPRIRGSWRWWQFQLRRRMNVAAWKRVRTILHRALGVPEAPIESSHFVGLRRGQRMGWWPG